MTASEQKSKSVTPWSIKGIDRDARETAKEKARANGMTLGEWLNTMIQDAGENGGVSEAQVREIAEAISLLGRKVTAAEEKGAEAVQDLARNFGGVVERVQRLERSSPAGDTAELSERVATLEEKSTDRQRIDALMALEKAVAQMAVQFETTQKTSVERLDSQERQLKTILDRLEDRKSGEDAATNAALDHLKIAIEGLSTRIARAEKIASEAANAKAEVTAETDPTFVERTGKRLRVLGDEIKRGGDQIRALETSIERLSGQIDEAERRSAEGVQKVSETIAGLRDQLLSEQAAPSPTVSPDAVTRRDLQTAMTVISEQTDHRLSELSGTVEAALARLEQQYTEGMPNLQQSASSDVLPAALLATDAVSDTADEEIPELQLPDLQSGEGQEANGVNPADLLSRAELVSPSGVGDLAGTAGTEATTNVTSQVGPGTGSNEGPITEIDIDEIDPELLDLQDEIESAFAELDIEETPPAPQAATNLDGTAGAPADVPELELPDLDLLSDPDLSGDQETNGGLSAGDAAQDPTSGATDPFDMLDPETDGSTVSAESAESDPFAAIDDFDFDLDGETAATSAETKSTNDTRPETAEASASQKSILDDVRNAFGFGDDNESAAPNNPSAQQAVPDQTEAPSVAGVPGAAQQAAAESQPASEKGDLDDAMGVLDDLDLDEDTPPPPFGRRHPAEPDTDGEEAGEEVPPFVSETEPTEEKGAGGNYLKAARAAAREAAARAEEDSKKPKSKRKLTPKQRAILLAKAKRKKVEALRAAEAKKGGTDAPLVADELLPDTDKTDSNLEETTDEPKGPLAKLKSLLPGKKTNDGTLADSVPSTEGSVSDSPLEDLDDLGAALADDEGHKKSGGLQVMTAGPVTIVLVIGIVLTLAVLAFLAKDLLTGSQQATPSLTFDRPTQGAVASNGSDTVGNAGTSDDRLATPAFRDSESTLLQANEDDLIQPRALFLQSIEALSTATTDAEQADAIKTLQEAAALGHPPAQLQLGELFKTGRGVEKDLEQSRLWFERAANGGNILAMHRLGVMSARGDGGEVDINVSVGWFTKAANHGLVDSQYNLGATYHPSAEGDPAGLQDREKSYFWYSLAAKNGDEQAGALGQGVGEALSPDVRTRIQDEVASWNPLIPNEAANERPGA
ncbi:MAG: hypothetical protein AAFY84_05825 [Pseudomonadota bacterium]